MPTQITSKQREASNTIATANSSDLLNAMRSSGSQLYQDSVPLADGSLDALRGIGAAIQEYEPVYDEFMHLLGRIAMVIVKSAILKNPLAVFDKGYLEYGETVEEIFVRLAEPHQYDELVDKEPWHMLEQEAPNVESVFHYMNYQIYYKTTIIKKYVKMAFLSEQGMSDLIDRIVQAMYNGAKYDIYNMTMYMLGLNILEGRIKTVYYDDTDKKKYMGHLRGLSNSIALFSSSYNTAGVTLQTDFEDQVVLVSAWFDGSLDAESLAYAFHDDKADFKQRKIIINKWSELDYKRINQLLSTHKGQRKQVVFTQEQLDYLDSIKSLILSKDYIMIYTDDFEMTDFYNGEKRGWTYWLHDWKTFSASPYETAVAIASQEAKVTGITINPTSIDFNISEDGENISQPISGTVEGNIGVNKKVGWYTGDSPSDPANEEVTIVFENDTGSIITLKYKGEINNHDGKITAYSIEDPTKTATATIHFVVS